MSERESRRWPETAEQAKEVLASAAMVTVVDDREGDIYPKWAAEHARYRVGCQRCIWFSFDLAECVGVLATVKDKAHCRARPSLTSTARAG